MEIKSFSKGSVIFREGDAADCMLEVVSGTVGVYKNYGTPDQQLLKEFFPDQFLGEMGLLEHEPRSATAVAMEKDTCVEIISEESFSDFFRKDPVSVLKAMQQLSGNLRRTSRDYVEVCREIKELAGKEEQK